ncbi:ATP-binding protein [Rhodococcus sp. NPDC055112]
MSQLSDTGYDGDRENASVRVKTQIEIKVPAEPDQLAVVRAVASAVAAQRDFDIDAVADLLLAVDESCTRLLRRTLRDTLLECRFALTDTGVQFRVSGRVDPNDVSEWPEEGFSWHVLRSLTEDLTMRREPAVEPDQDHLLAAPGHLLMVEFAMRAGGPPA